MITPTQKVLIVSYYWPPAGGSGVQRWMYFAKYLKELGWEPIVITVEEQQASYAVWDKSLMEEVSHIRVIRTFTNEPLKWYSFLTTGSSQKGIPQGEVKRKSFLQKLAAYIRGNYFLPINPCNAAGMSAGNTTNLEFSESESCCKEEIYFSPSK